MLGSDKSLIFFFFLWNEIYDGIGENLLPNKAALIDSLNL